MNKEKSGPYCGKAPGIWKCPADHSTVVPSSGPFLGKHVPRVRSMSMSVWLGGFGGGLVTGLPGVTSPPWRLYRRLAEVQDPGPNRTLLFWDEREDWINYGNFFVDMNGFPNQPNLTQIDEFPASYHNGAGGLSFVDGHAEIKRWRDPRSTPPLHSDAEWEVQSSIASPNNPDIAWLQERATRRIQ